MMDIRGSIVLGVVEILQKVKFKCTFTLFVTLWMC